MIEIQEQINAANDLKKKKQLEKLKKKTEQQEWERERKVLLEQEDLW